MQVGRNKPRRHAYESSFRNPGRTCDSGARCTWDRVLLDGLDRRIAWRVGGTSDPSWRTPGGGSSVRPTTTGRSGTGPRAAGLWRRQRRRRLGVRTAVHAHHRRRRFLLVDVPSAQDHPFDRRRTVDSSFVSHLLALVLCSDLAVGPVSWDRSTSRRRWVRLAPRAVGHSLGDRIRGDVDSGVAGAARAAAVSECVRRVRAGVFFVGRYEQRPRLLADRSLVHGHERACRRRVRGNLGLRNARPLEELRVSPRDIARWNRPTFETPGRRPLGIRGWNRDRCGRGPGKTVATLGVR